MSPRSVLPCTRSSPARNNSLNAFRAKELSPSPVSYGTKPRGCERVHTLSRSPVGSQVAAKCAIRRARVLRISIAPFLSLSRGARGFTPSRALPWGRKTRPSAPYVAARVLRISIAPFLSCAAGGARGFTPTRALPWGRESQPRATEHSSPLNAAKSPLRTCLIY